MIRPVAVGKHLWQNRRLGEHAPAWDPAGEHSPNTLFAAAMAQGGFALTIPAPEVYYALLPAHYVKIHARRGVKVGGLWYDGPALDPYRGQPSARGGRHKGKWVVRRDRRDCRFTYFQDPETGAWHTLRWTGLPPDDQVPAFSDARVQELLEQARRRGLAPRSDAELLPVLLELLAGHVPVDRWPTQQRPKRRRTARAREAVQTAAAARDRPSPAAAPADRAAGANVVPLDPDGHARQVQDAVDAERRRRREQAVPVAPPPPPRLGETSRRRSLLVLATDDAADPPDEPQAEAGPPAPGQGR